VLQNRRYCFHARAADQEVARRATAEQAQTPPETSSPAALSVPTGLLYQLQHLLSVINRVGIEVRKEIQTVKQTDLQDWHAPSSGVKPPGRNSA
jgi:hypothetical protein